MRGLCWFETKKTGAEKRNGHIKIFQSHYHHTHELLIVYARQMTTEATYSTRTLMGNWVEDRIAANYPKKTAISYTPNQVRTAWGCGNASPAGSRIHTIHELCSLPRFHYG